MAGIEELSRRRVLQGIGAAGVLAGVEVGMDLAGVKIQKGGVTAALNYFAQT